MTPPVSQAHEPAMRRGGRLPHLLLVAALAVLLAVAPRAAPAGAQEADRREGDDDLSLTVQQLTGTLSPGGQLDVRIRMSNRGGRTAEGLRVVGTLHRAVPSRFALQLAVDDGQFATVIDSVSADVDELAAGRSTVVELDRSADLLGLQRADQFGVYPLRFQLLEHGEAVDEVRTALVFAPERVEEPVRAAFLVPIDAPPLLRTTHAYDRDLLRDHMSRAGRVKSLIGTLAARDGIPATLAPNPLLLDEAADLAGGFPVVEDPREDAPEAEDAAEEEPTGGAAGAPETDGYFAAEGLRFLERTREVAARHDVDVLAMPYGRADLPALVRGTMVAEAVRHVEESRATLTRLTGTDAVEGALWPADGLDAATLATVLRAEVDTLVLSERHLEIPDRAELSPSPLRELARTRGASPTVLVPDPWLEDILAEETAPDGVAVAVQRVLAETAAVYFERPFAEDVRGLVLAPPQYWSPDRGLAAGLLDAIDQAPWLKAVTLSGLTRALEPDETPVSLDYSSTDVEQELPPSYVAALSDARRSLGSLASVLAAARDDTPSRFDRLLRAAASVHFRSSPDIRHGRAMIEEVADSVAGLYSSIEIAEGPQVWMDEEGPVPVTVVNTADVPMKVRVRLLSPRFDFLDDPDGKVEVLEPNTSHTLTFRARAVTRGGRAPISIRVEDPDGVLVLAEDTVSVRSTAVSVAALVVTGAAGLFLFVWFVRQAARRRRDTRPDDAAPEPPPRPPAEAGSTAADKRA